jgi:LPS-assembly lipoprotein
MQSTFLVFNHRMMRYVGLMLLALGLAACGFQLRGTEQIAFKKIHIQGATLSLSRDLVQAFKVNDVEVVSSPDKADIILDLIAERNQKNILSLSGRGLVREFELRYIVEFRTRNASEPIFAAPQAVELRTDLSYNDDALLGKLEEEQRLNADMRKNAVREIIRRLSAISGK